MSLPTHLHKTWLPVALGLVLALAACAAPVPTGDAMPAEPMAEATQEGDAMMEEAKTGEGAMTEETPTADAMMEEQGEDEAMMEHPSLHLEITGLEDLGEGWAYEGWLIIDGAPVSTGVFTVDGDGSLRAQDFTVPGGEAYEQATAFVLTIEPSPDPDPAPSAVHLLAGDLVDGQATLSVGHPAALGNDFTTAGGSYLLALAAPARGDAGYKNGVWFHALNLPALPEGWVYEGWVVGPDGPRSTGRFRTPQERDSDGTGPEADGPGSGPAFPGQDYIDSPIDLTAGYAAVISIEPEPDNSPAPFTLKPLVDPMIEDVGDHGEQAFEQDLGSFPAGMVVLTKME